MSCGGNSLCFRWSESSLGTTPQQQGWQIWTFSCHAMMCRKGSLWFSKHMTPTRVSEITSPVQGKLFFSRYPARICYCHWRRFLQRNSCCLHSLDNIHVNRYTVIHNACALWHYSIVAIKNKCFFEIKKMASALFDKQVTGSSILQHYLRHNWWYIYAELHIY